MKFSSELKFPPPAPGQLSQERRLMRSEALAYRICKEGKSILFDDSWAPIHLEAAIYWRNRDREAQRMLAL